MLGPNIVFVFLIQVCLKRVNIEFTNKKFVNIPFDFLKPMYVIPLLCVTIFGHLFGQTYPTHLFSSPPYRKTLSQV